MKTSTRPKPSNARLLVLDIYQTTFLQLTRYKRIHLGTGNELICLAWRDIVDPHDAIDNTTFDSG